MKKDRPSFQFYPSDWLGDSALRSCRPRARALWIDMLCLMHEGQPYGYLTLPNGEKMSDKTLSIVSGFAKKYLTNVIQELRQKGVVSVTENGILYSKRMVEDERIRRIRAESGHRGGNPNLVNHLDKQKSTPSSSSSSSSISAARGLVNQNGHNGTKIYQRTATAKVPHNRREGPNDKREECEWCGPVPPHVKCHSCFKLFDEGEDNDNHRCL